MHIDSLLPEFVLDRVLREDSSYKSITLLGKIKDQYCIIVAEKTAFDTNALSAISQPEAINLDLENNIYHRAFVALKSDAFKLPSAKYSIIYPATEVHIAKYTAQKKRMIAETPELYTNVVQPYIQTMLGSRIDWVFNILKHEAEVDRILFEDTDPVQGFILLPDLKWDGKTLSALYMCAIVHRRDLQSLRDLRGEHIGFLQHLKEESQAAVKAKYGLEASQLRLYIHYQPSYYHLHIHVQSSDAEAGEGLAAGKAWLLDDDIALYIG
ncbi:m7GpppN diphosphatase [Protomyces lactucae-debilis]|uniref:M7GpppN diphosphatase n=1 Tax=Protomyces lactucae-debilis TaxID=2754530 RepID=A0A1Y2EQT6_PROLT|nr:m7GpppN diphosphatase [Protomyces lactucae-debilis]ORY73897.1 m7GpppN diphosphatase [Protomyces lactucae-debilis]